MRRISRTVALASALVVAGCMGGSGSGSNSTGAEGVAENTFAVAVQNGQAVGGLPGNPSFAIKGGRVTSVPTGIDCGEGFALCNASFPTGTTVVLTAAPLNASYAFVMYAGDCGGTACSVEGPADRYVVAQFRGVNDPAGHPNYTSGTVHGPATYAWLAATGSTAAALDCRTCHGANLQGIGIAPSCKSCHEGMAHIQLDYTTFATGPSVSAACVKCHDEEARKLLTTNHFTWLGSSTSVGHTTPNSIGKRNVINNFCVANASNESRCMQCHPSYSSAPTKDPVSGAVAVNTGPMYLWNTNAAVDLSKIDCLVCHANLGVSKYMKSPAGFGQPWPNTGLPCAPSCAANQICSNVNAAGQPFSDGKNYCRAPLASETSSALNLAANNVGAPNRSNCGFCHFNAGGGDNVKMGDLGSALKAPTQAVDVHMGSTASYAPQTCVGCHESGGHGAIKGSGLSIPVDNEGRLTCTDCHSGLHAPDHSAVGLPAVHLDFIACQTCHIPAFSRTQFTKMNWDWQTAADKQACQGLAGCVPFGSVMYPDTTTVVAGVGGEAPKGAVVTAYPSPIEAVAIEQAYDWKKGISTYAKGVTPAYRWIAPSTGQQGTHETTARNGLLGTGTPADPYRLSDPLPPPAPVLAGWKIAPFKKMTGRSPAFADTSAMIVPHVFGPDSLWQNDLRGYPMVANTLGSAGNPWDQTKANAVWTATNNYGAAVGGQLGNPIAKASATKMTRDAAHLVTVETSADLPATMPATLFLIGAEAAFPSGVKTVAKVDARHFTYTEAIPYTVNTGTAALPALPAISTQPVAFYAELKGTDWTWANTVMFINLNHEVAPKASALSCANCHPALGGSVATSRMKELYNLSDTGCTDPTLCSKR